MRQIHTAKVVLGTASAEVDGNDEGSRIGKFGGFVNVESDVVRVWADGSRDLLKLVGGSKHTACAEDGDRDEGRKECEHDRLWERRTMSLSE